MGLNPMLQQWSITQVVVTLTEDILELLKQGAGVGRGTLGVVVVKVFW